MEIIEIAKDEVLTDDDSIQDYVDVLNGIVWDCVHGGFKSGYRNQVAVDLTVASYMLGFDADDVLHWLVDKYEVIDPKDDDEDTFARIERIKGYSGSFSWEWMIDPEYYQSIAQEHANHDMPLRFQL